MIKQERPPNNIYLLMESILRHPGWHPRGLPEWCSVCTEPTTHIGAEGRGLCEVCWKSHPDGYAALCPALREWFEAKERGLLIPMHLSWTEIPS